jgi:hypothetical protein
MRVHGALVLTERTRLVFAWPNGHVFEEQFPIYPGSHREADEHRTILPPFRLRGFKEYVLDAIEADIERAHCFVLSRHCTNDEAKELANLGGTLIPSPDGTINPGVVAEVRRRFLSRFRSGRAEP